MHKILLEVQDLYQFFGERCVLWKINFKVAAGQIVGLVGPSGCGKSTLLKAILGTDTPTRGKILIYSKSRDAMKEVTKPSRDIGIVYQKYTLFPNLTALKSVAFGLMVDETTIPGRALRYIPKYNKRRNIKISWAKLRKIHLEEAAEWLKKLKLADAMNKYPHQLSGGMQQRVAIAQALIMKPKVLLLDEPFGALDEATREELQTMLLGLYEENVQAIKNNEMPPYTIVLVTHELNEAILVGDRVIGLSQYWNYAKEEDPCAKNASTIVYDKASPVFKPTMDRDYSLFTEQRNEIRSVAFDSSILQDIGPYITFWQQVKDGECREVMRDLKETTAKEKDENAEQSENKKGGVS